VARPEQTKEAVLSGAANANIRFDELCALMRYLGFKERTKGSHHIYNKTGVIHILNLQPRPDGKAKPYQVRQVRQAIIQYSL
jgi:predicted RNA binding protein YcfA (HicA-like mRNA interferase family)